MTEESIMKMSACMGHGSNEVEFARPGTNSNLTLNDVIDTMNER